jgi:serine/threonine protein phosphatase PrpC
MEDKHVASALNDQKSYLFGIFDGHGGIFFSIKDYKLQPLSKSILLSNFNAIGILRTVIMRKH